ncbi:hypothetical protein SASPL_141411 [Salvia splendens]|uniref:Uncharacterized protein n=2 Tax=Salvia splendens TaxID=180675 RepID=A0A8X8ZCJ2_SALSN|nr:hypothetical protein SASPL_141411 [Salvia splendens]
MDRERDGVEENISDSHSRRVISNRDLGDGAINDNEHGSVMNRERDSVEENTGDSHSSRVISNAVLGEGAINDNEHGSETSSDSSSSKSSCEDIVRVSSQIEPPDSVGESSIHGGSSRSEECVKDESPILSPSVRVMESPDDDSPAYFFSNDSPTMEGNSSLDEFLFSIHMGDDSFSSSYDATTDTVADVEKSTEHLKGNESRNSGELGGFDQICATTKGVDPDMGKTASVDVKHGEKRMVGEPLNNVPVGLVNNQVDTSARGSVDTSYKHKPNGTIALPK